MNTEKIYIGKGTQVKNFDMVNVTINVSQAEAHIFEYKGEKFLKITVAKTKATDKFGKTHAAYINTYSKQPESTAAVKENSSATATATKPKKAKKAVAKEKIEPSFSNH